MTAVLVVAALAGSLFVGAPRGRSAAPDAPAPDGYWLVASDGGIFTFGNARFLGSTGAMTLNKPIVGMAPTPTGNGYWLVASDGGIFTFGDARFLGSTGAVRLNRPIVGMLPTRTGDGYWLVASDGGIFTFGDARFLGSTGAIALNRPIVGMGRTPTGNGYWLVASDGGIFTFGDARFLGSTGATALNKPIVGMAPTPTGNGYWLVASDGGIFTFGDAAFMGSTGGLRLNSPIGAMAPHPNGYWLVAADGGVFTFGEAPFLGSTGNIRLNNPIVGMATNSGTTMASSGTATATSSTTTATTGTTTATTTTVAPPPDPKIAGAGDISCDPNDPAFNAGNGTATRCRMKYTSDLLLGKGYAGVFTLGDNQYQSGTLSNFQQSYELSWGRAKSITRPATGNHDPGDGYWDYFNGVGAADGPAGPRGKGWYSYDVGTWHVVVLNSNCAIVACTAGSEQEQWLRQDLAANAAKCTLAMWHHPRWGSGSHGDNALIQPIWQALYDHGADVALTGHDHNYERLKPLDAAGAIDEARGIRSFVVGTGGHSLGALGPTVARSEVRNNDTYGVLELTLRSSSYDWRFIPESASATFTDSGTGSCH